MDALAEIRGIYFDECDEFTGLLEGYLAAMAEGRASSEDINGAFRAVHSIKGGAGAFGLSDLVAFAHRFEACLDSLRSGRVSVDAAPIATLLQAGDVLSTLITAARDGTKLDVEPALIAALEAFGGAPPTTRPSEFDLDIEPSPAPAAAETAAPAAPATRSLTVRIAPDADMFRRALDPRMVFDALKVLRLRRGDVRHERGPGDRRSRPLQLPSHLDGHRQYGRHSHGRRRGAGLLHGGPRIHGQSRPTMTPGGLA